jgi:peptide/nickel transport system ATP-binding protein
MIFENRSSLFAQKRRVQAIESVDMEIKEGQIYALVGESGCGKTTLGKIICGLLKPSEEGVYFNGKNVWRLRGKEFTDYRRSVQLVHQDSYAALNPARTIFQSLSAPLFRYKIAKNRNEAYEHLEELFEMVGLTPAEQFLYKYPHQLSGGQRQRILLARALSIKPKLIVADEPVSMVDVSLRISLLNLMLDMNEKFGISFVYITHDLATARYIAANGNIAVMYLGKIVEYGQLDNVLSKPRHPYLQALLSAVPIPNPKIARSMKPLPLKSLDMPDPTNPPSGCRFHPRCPYGEERCSREVPELAAVEEDRFVACHLVEKIPEWKWGQ